MPDAGCPGISTAHQRSTQSLCRENPAIRTFAVGALQIPTRAPIRPGSEPYVAIAWWRWFGRLLSVHWVVRRMRSGWRSTENTLRRGAGRGWRRWLNRLWLKPAAGYQIGSAFAAANDYPYADQTQADQQSRHFRAAHLVSDPRSVWRTCCYSRTARAPHVRRRIGDPTAP